MPGKLSYYILERYQMHFIDSYSVILLDLCNTFMFNVDRFSDKEDYALTYYKLGGKNLTSGKIKQIIHNLYRDLEDAYVNPKYFDHFPAVRYFLDKIAKELPKKEIDLLEEVFSHHEVGNITIENANVLKQLAKTHELGIVSNIWSKSDLYLIEIEKVGIKHLFKTIVFSSEHGPMKPSPLLFQKAVDCFDIPLSKIVFVGDSFDYDIVGAVHFGMSAIWINPIEEKLPHKSIVPNLMIKELKDLLTV